MPEHDWMYSVHVQVKEDILEQWPKPKGKVVRMSTFKDANLGHCKVTGKSITGIVHFVMQTPVEWFSKLQSTVETATFGSEFVAARIATEQIMDIRYTLMAMGVPVEQTSWLLGYNGSVIMQSTIPHSVLKKRHNALAYHKVRWAIAAKIMKFCKVAGTENIADVLTKFLQYNTAWPLLQPVLFWYGETEMFSSATNQGE